VAAGAPILGPPGAGALAGGPRLVGSPTLRVPNVGLAAARLPPVGQAMARLPNVGLAMARCPPGGLQVACFPAAGSWTVGPRNQRRWVAEPPAGGRGSRRAPVVPGRGPDRPGASAGRGPGRRLVASARPWLAGARPPGDVPGPPARRRPLASRCVSGRPDRHARHVTGLAVDPALPQIKKVQ